MVGVWMFRKWFLNVNWRITFVWTTMLVGCNCIFQYVMIEFHNGWFYAFSNNIHLVLFHLLHPFLIVYFCFRQIINAFLFLNLKKFILLTILAYFFSFNIY